MADLDNKKMWGSILKAKDLPQFENETITEWLQGVIRFALREQNLRFDGKEIVPATEEEILQEPKFHKGDWLVHKDLVGVIICITQIHAPHYYLTNNNSFIKFGEENNYRPWTIQDAKNGDVLSYVTDEEDLWIMIYWSLYEPYEGHVHYHALLVNDNFDDKGTCCICIDDLKPATKEQRELLFQKMKEEGYEWDADTKQLKKIGFDDVDPNHLIHEHIDPQELVSSELDEFENRLGGIIFPTWDIMQGCESCQADIDHVKELAKDLLSIARKQIAGENELTWQDINTLERIINNVHYEFRNGIGEESFGEEVLERFRETKDYEHLDDIEKPVEWSEEDDQYLLVCKNALAKYQVSDKWDAGIISRWLENRLKSLRSKSHWKPTEEQLESLKNSFTNGSLSLSDIENLETLYEQLKALL